MNKHLRVSMSALLMTVMMGASVAALVHQVPAERTETDTANHVLTVSAIIENFTATWVDPPSGLTVLDGTTVARTDMMIAGYTDPFAQVVVQTSAGNVTTTGNDTGYYEAFPVNLTSGLNVATVTTTNASGVTASVLKIIISDTYCQLVLLKTPGITRNPSMDIAGLTEPGATVRIDDLAYAPNPDGSFDVSIALSEGLNVIYVNATDAVGNQNDQIVQVVLDTTPPALTISFPADGTNVSQPNVMVSGTTEAGATVLVNGVLASNGSADWAAIAPLVQGPNLVIVAATDEAGNSVSQTVNVTYLPPNYVTPEELAAVQSELMGLINNLTLSQAENVSALQGQIVGLQTDIYNMTNQILVLHAALSENVTDLQNQVAALQGQIDAMTANISGLQAALAENVSILQSQISTAGANVTALETMLAENVSALQAADNATLADLQANVSALDSAIAENATALQTTITTLQGNVSSLQVTLATQIVSFQTQIDAMTANVNALQGALQSQIDGLNASVHNDLTDLQDQMNNMNQSTQNDINSVDSKAQDANEFATMLMYLTLILFAIAIILVGLVWYMMNSKIGGGGGAGESLEQVDEMPSEVEREFEELEKELKDEES